MITCSKRLVFILCLIVPCVVVAKKSKNLQIIVNPADQRYFFVLNNGSGLSNGAFPRAQGSYFITNGFIFPGGTVSKNQSSYLVDKNGNPLDFDNDSLGMLYVHETMLQTVDFGGELPAPGTVIETSQWHLLFNKKCDGKQNALFATGFAKMGIFTIGQGDVAFKFFMSLVGGLGCNSDVHNNTYVAKAYISENGQSTLIKIKFDQDIVYRKNNNN